MREILFRGFHPCEDGDITIYVEGDAIKGQWVEGIPYHRTKNIVFMLMPLPLEDIREVKDEKGKKCYDIIFSFKEVISSTIGQYTGLTEKNKKKIFEGDIILAKDIGYKAIVEWQPDTCRFLAIITNRRDERSPHFFYVDKGNDRGSQMSSNEVIGTIFDKKENNDN